MAVPVPQPPGFPLVGNIGDIDPRNAMLSLQHLSEKYGRSPRFIITRIFYANFYQDQSSS